MGIKKLTAKKLQQIWDKEAQSYSLLAENSPDYLAYFQTLEEVIGKLKNKQILDVGSGTAIASAYFAQMGAEVTLIDISKKALAFGRKYFRYKNIRGKFLRQNAFNMQFSANYFDVVWNGGVIEHFVDADKLLMIQKMWRLVKPGGLLLITAPNFWDIPFMLAKQILLWRKRWNFGEEDDLTQTRLKKLFIQAGVTGHISTITFNPIVGWWFFPFGKELTEMLKLNTTCWHNKRCAFGHNVAVWATKQQTN